MKSLSIMSFSYLLWMVMTMNTQAATLIKFSGYEWAVKESNYMGPGPNAWSRDNVWVDAYGQLHLKITHKDGKWYSAQVTNTKSLGYGTYEFYVKGRVDLLDPNVVLGMYTYDTYSSDDYYKEIDIEFAKWGNPDNPIGQFVIQPGRTGQKQRFDVSLNGNYSSHAFTWRPNSVAFKSAHGHHPIGYRSSVIQESEMRTGVPKEGSETARINLWLDDGLPPKNGEEVEIVVSKFVFTPMEFANR